MSERGVRRIPPPTWILLVGIVAWMLGVWVVRRVPLRSPERSPLAPRLELRDSRDRPLVLSELRGRVVLLDLWASWCGPCRDEVPRLSRIQRDLGGRGLVVVGLSAESLPPATLDRIRREWRMGYEVASATSPLDGTSYEGEGFVPHHWLIDRAGRVRASRAGILSERALRSALSELLDEPWSGSAPAPLDSP